MSASAFINIGPICETFAIRISLFFSHLGLHKAGVARLLAVSDVRPIASVLSRQVAPTFADLHLQRKRSVAVWVCEVGFERL